MCEKCQITFIGPPARVIELMGDKTTARQTAIEAGVPVIPGTPGVVGSLSDAIKAAEEIGYPVMVKASSGGGGRGIRIAVSHEELPDAIKPPKARLWPVLAMIGFISSVSSGIRVILKFNCWPIRMAGLSTLVSGIASIQRRNQKILEGPVAFY